MGKECVRIYENLNLDTDDKKKSDAILKKLSEHFKQQWNIIYERYIFNLEKQEPNESLDEFLNRLKKLSATFQFKNYTGLLDEMLRDSIVTGINSNQVRARWLRESKLRNDGS